MLKKLKTHELLTFILFLKKTNEKKLVVKNLIKNFKKSGKTFTAVNQLSFGIKHKECFG